MLKKLVISAIFLCLTTKIFADEYSNQELGKLTSLHLISSDKDYVTLGKTYIYKKNDGVFSIHTNTDKNRIDFYFDEFKEDQYGSKADWHISFGAQKSYFLHVGKFINCIRMGWWHQPSLSIGGCGRGNNDSIGKFEILDLSFNDFGEVESFAANATLQARPKGSPVFAGVRYNSNIPVEVKVSDIFGTQLLPESFFAYVLKNKNNEIREQKLCTEKEFKFDYAFNDLEERLIVNVKKEDEIFCSLEFGTSDYKVFETGVAEDTKTNNRYDDYPKILIRQQYSTYIKGQFKVLSFRKNKYGKIKELAINFKVVDFDNRPFEGAIRYHSDLPVNLDNPFGA